MESTLAPIVLFVYNRPWHVKQTLKSLLKNDLARESLLYIFADGPKENADEETIKRIAKTRGYIKKKKWCKEVFVIEREFNLGLAKSIINGVTEILNKHDKIIVLEDDLILSPFFLKYMNDSLRRYENNEKVGQIGACNFFACGNKYPNTFFTPIPDCWGWATWKNRWNNFNTDGSYLLTQIVEKDLTHKFNAYGSYDMMGMLKMQIEGKADSWAIRWQAVCVLNNWLTLYPNPAFTNHIDSKDATHVNMNITPPMCIIEPNFETVDTVEIPEVISELKRYIADMDQYYVNSKTARKIPFYRKLILAVFPTRILDYFKKFKKRIYG